MAWRYHAAMEGVWNTLATLLSRGGWVMIPLFILSVIAIALSIERAIFWWRTHRAMSASHLTALAASLRAGDGSSVIRRGSGEGRSIFGQLVQRMEEHESASASEAVAVEIVESMRNRFERFMPTLSTIITAAPLIGILGTVIGIIDSFELLGASRMVTDPREVSSGIAEALITTAAGLVVALITLFPYMAFKGYVNRALGQFEVLIAAMHAGNDAKDAKSSRSITSSG